MGNFSIRVLNTKSEVDEVDIVQVRVILLSLKFEGTVVMVDGIFGEDISLRLGVQGFYQWEQGNLVLLGSSEGSYGYFLSVPH